MKWFDNWFYKQVKRAWEQGNSIELVEESPRRSRKGGLTAVGRRVEHNYDDESVISFKVIGANGGMIVETSRYDEKRDNESIRRYVIDESADVAESLGRIVTTEFLR